MTTDLPPDVRAEAVRDAKTALRSACGTSISTNAAIQMVDAVVSVAAPEIERPLQARIAALEDEVARRKRSGEAINTECEQIGEKADEAWRALNPYMARVEVLTAALHELAAIADRVCRQVADETEVDWTGLLRNKVTNARAVLAKGEKP